MSKVLKILFPLIALTLIAVFVIITLSKPGAKQSHTTERKAFASSETKPEKPIEQITEPKRVLYLPILMYHHIGTAPEMSDKVEKGLTVSEKEFEQQLLYLKTEGFTSLSLQNLLDYTKGTFILPKKPIIFTFDDGYKDSFSQGIPLLKKYGFTGSFAIITQWTGQTFGSNVYASWDEIKQAQKDGMEIVSHTQNHFDGSNPIHTKEGIYGNLLGSKTDIQKNTGTNTFVLVYPYGHFTEAYIEQAQKAGFAMGITTEEGNTIDTTNLMKIPRVRISPNMSLEKLKEKLNPELPKTNKTPMPR